MTDEEHNAIEAIESLRQAAYNSFNDRRVYEWKLNISIWTSLAIVIAGLLQGVEVGKKFPLGSTAWMYALGIGVVLVFLHAYWSHGAARANSIDKGVALIYARTMHERLSLKPFGVDVQSQIDALPKRTGWLQWSHLAQVSITAALAMGVVSLIFARGT